MFAILGGLNLIEDIIDSFRAEADLSRALSNWFGDTFLVLIYSFVFVLSNLYDIFDFFFKGICLLKFF